MAGRGKKKRARDDEAGNRGGPGLEQQLEEEHAEKIIDEKGKDKIYREKEKVFFKLLEKFIGEHEIFPKFKDYPAKLIRKITEENPEFKEYEAISRESGEFKKNRKSWENRLDKFVKNDGTNEFKDKDTFRHLCGLEMTIGSHAAFASFHHGSPGVLGGTNAAAGSSVGHTTQSSPNNEELKEYEAFCEFLGITDVFKDFSENNRKRIEVRSKGTAEQELELKEKSNKLEEVLKCDFTILQKGQELFKEFCEKEGILEKFKGFCEQKVEEHRKLCEQLSVVSEHLSKDGADQFFYEKIQKIPKNFSKNLEIEMIPNRRDKSPATAYTARSHSPVVGFTAEACQNNRLFSTNEGTQIQTGEAAYEKEAPTSSLLKTCTYAELGQGSNCDPMQNYGFSDVDILDFDISDVLLDFPRDLAGNLAGSSNLASNWEGELQSSTTLLTAVAMNSTGTGEPHHDSLTMQGRTTAAAAGSSAGSSSGPRHAILPTQ